MATRITEPQVCEVLRLKGMEWSNSAIAAFVNIGRTSVKKIVRGELTGKRKSRSARDPMALPGGIMAPDVTNSPERCSQCGVLVYIPCLACQVRELKGIKI